MLGISQKLSQNLPSFHQFTWCFEHCDSPNAWIPGVWPGRGKKRLEFASTYHDRNLFTPAIKGAKREIYKVPLASGFKLGLCGMVSSFFGGWVVRVVWNPIFSSSFCCYSPTWAPPTTTQFLRKAKKSWGPGWLWANHDGLFNLGIQTWR